MRTGLRPLFQKWLKKRNLTAARNVVVTGATAAIEPQRGGQVEAEVVAVTAEIENLCGPREEIVGTVIETQSAPAVIVGTGTGTGEEQIAEIEIIDVEAVETDTGEIVGNALGLVIVIGIEDEAIDHEVEVETVAIETGIASVHLVLESAGKSKKLSSCKALRSAN